MKLVIVESIIGSIPALLGETFYAGRTSGSLFAVVLEKNPVPTGQKKLLRGASKSLPRYGVLFSYILWSEFPYTGVHFGTLQRGSVEASLCQQQNAWGTTTPTVLFSEFLVPRATNSYFLQTWLERCTVVYYILIAPPPVDYSAHFLNSIILVSVPVIFII